MSDGRMNVVVVGSGAFGTALATVIADAGKARVTLLARNRLMAERLSQTRKHDVALPGIALSPALAFTADDACLEVADTVLFVMPSQAQREAARHYRDRLKPGAVVVTCAKGIEKATGHLLTDVLAEELPNHPVGVLSGPGFAADIARGLPTAMVVAGPDMVIATSLAEALSGRTFRLYPSNDRIGVQLGGALKNVLAIASGVVEGAGLGDSARAALISRGLAEMSRLVAAMGGRAATVQGLSGLGDLVLTATSHQSRNLRFGISLGEGRHVATSGGELVEGAHAASVASRLSHEHDVELPITDAVAAMIDGRLDVASALDGLMSRPIRNE